MNKIIKKHLTNLEAELTKQKAEFLDSLARCYIKLSQTEKYSNASDENKEFQRWFISESLWTLHFQDYIESIEKRIRRIKMNFGTVKNSSKITPAMIEKAKNHPIENLLEVNKQGFAKCFNHKDKKPSLYCKNNFAYCFVCQKSWDTIQILVDKNKMSFNQAVKKLC